MSLTDVQPVYPPVRRADHAPCGMCGQTSPYRRYAMSGLAQPVCWRCYKAAHQLIEAALCEDARQHEYDRRHRWGQDL